MAVSNLARDDGGDKEQAISALLHDALVCGTGGVEPKLWLAVF
jgi:hypothetical protein